MLPVHDDVGRAISSDEERRLLDACGNSRSRSLLPAVTVALSTGMRYSEIRLLRSNQIDLVSRLITVGPSKTESGTGRSIPLNERATATLKVKDLRAKVDDAKSHHFVLNCTEGSYRSWYSDSGRAITLYVSRSIPL